MYYIIYIYILCITLYIYAYYIIYIYILCITLYLYIHILCFTLYIYICYAICMRMCIYIYHIMTCHAHKTWRWDISSNYRDVQEPGITEMVPSNVADWKTRGAFMGKTSINVRFSIYFRAEFFEFSCQVICTPPRNLSWLPVRAIPHRPRRPDSCHATAGWWLDWKVLGNTCWTQYDLVGGFNPSEKY